VAGVLFGLIPVFKYAGPQLATSLRSGGRTASQSRERHRARNTLVVVQVALALVLLIVSGLMIRTFQAMREVQPGFTKPQEIQTLRISIPEAQVKEPERVARMQQDILEKIGAGQIQSMRKTAGTPTDKCLRFGDSGSSRPACSGPWATACSLAAISPGAIATTRYLLL